MGSSMSGGGGSYNAAARAQSEQRAAAANVDDVTPSKNAAPLIITSPYSYKPSRIMDANDFAIACQLCCDPYTAEQLQSNMFSRLTGSFTPLGISLIEGTRPRYMLDLDRKPNSINPAFHDKPITFQPDEDDVYAAHGIGVTWMRAPGDLDMPLYIGGQIPTRKQIDTLIEEEYEPYHDILQRTIAHHLERFGGSMHLSLQPFSREEAIMLGADPAAIPHFALSDNGGTTAHSEFLEKLASTIAGKGYVTTINEIFPAGEITRRHGSPDMHSYAIQVKILDELYTGPMFPKFSRDLHAIAMTMAEYSKRRARELQAEPADNVVTVDFKHQNHPEPGQ